MTKRLLIVLLATVSIFTASAMLIMTNTTNKGNLEIVQETSEEIIIETTITIEDQSTVDVYTTSVIETTVNETTVETILNPETTTVEETTVPATEEETTKKKPTKEDPTKKKEESTTKKKEEVVTTYPTLSNQSENSGSIGSSNMSLIRNTIYSEMASVKSLNSTNTMKNVAIYCAKNGASASSVGKTYGLGTLKGCTTTVTSKSAESEDVIEATKNAWKNIKSSYKSISSSCKDVGVGINVSKSNGKYKITIYIACK